MIGVFLVVLVMSRSIFTATMNTAICSLGYVIAKLLIPGSTRYKMLTRTVIAFPITMLALNAAFAFRMKLTLVQGGAVVFKDGLLTLEGAIFHLSFYILIGLLIFCLELAAAKFGKYMGRCESG